MCEISNGGVTTWRWLCARHQSDRRGSGWSVKPVGRDAPWPCDDCETTAEDAVRFALTRAESRLPTRRECPRPGQPETWVARLERLKKQQEAA